VLYSIIARFHVWSANDKITDTLEQLFDNRDEGTTILIPKHLRRLANKTIEFGLDYKTLLYEHTILPFALCFLNKSSFDYILDVVNDNGQEEKSLYIYKNNLIHRYLRYCSLCVGDDRVNYGEAYWHRKHQLNGLEMCDKHRCRLKESSIDVIDIIKNRYLALELLDDIAITFEEEDKSDYRIELQIASDVDYIFQNYEFVRNIIWEKSTLIKETMIVLLFKRELATIKGIVKLDRLNQEFQDMYSSTQLKQLVEELEV
jgi:hypothetical protein